MLAASRLAIALLILVAFVPEPTMPDRDRALARLKSLVAEQSGQPTDEQLLEIESSAKSSRAAALAKFLRAYIKYSKGDFEQAASLFDEVSAKSVNLGDYALYFKALSLNKQSRCKEVAELARRLAESYPDSLYGKAALLLSGNCFLQAKNYAAAVSVVSKLAEDNDAAALMLLARSYEAEGRLEEALQTYERIYYEAPASPESSEAQTLLLAKGKAVPQVGRRLLTRAERLYKAGMYAACAEAFSLIATEMPLLLDSSQSRLMFGVSLHNIGKHSLAIKYLLSVDASSEDYLKARFLAAISAQKVGNLEKFTELALQLLDTNLPEEYAAELLAKLIEINSRTAPVLTEKYRARLIRDYPNSKQADEISYKEAWKLHLNKKPEQALDALLKHMCNIPQTNYRGQVAFWAGRNAEAIGNLARAVAIYQALQTRYRYGYYGFLAERRLKQILGKHPKLKAEIPQPDTTLACALATIQPAKPLPDTAGEKEMARVLRAVNLQIIGLSDLALAELEEARRLAATSHRVNLEIARIHYARGEYLQATRVLQRAHPDYLAYQGGEVSEEVFKIFFPLNHWETIKEEARKYSLDPFVIAGLIRQESHFEPKARSRANALGLMQLLPSTAKLVAKKNGERTVTAEDLFQPELNIKLGVSYLAEMMNKYGRLEYAAAAYNGGPGRVSRWLKSLPQDIDEWVEAIPIAETKGYVQGVIRNSAHYRRLYGDAR